LAINKKSETMHGNMNIKNIQMRKVVFSFTNVFKWRFVKSRFFLSSGFQHEV